MYIKEEEIVTRAGINGSEDELALLIKRLIYASLKSGGSIRFKTGKAARTGGWDGVVQAEEATIHVSEGTSIWELSNQQSGLNRKFDSDYDRIKKKRSIKRGETSVVFATMNRWPDHENWSSLKRNRIGWKNLYTLTASELAGWINQCPAVLAWARFTFNLGSEGLLSVDEYIYEVTHKGLKPKNIEDFLLQKLQEKNTAEKWIAGSPSTLLVKGKTREEAIAFFCAVVEKLPEEEKEKIKSNTVIVNSASELLFVRRKYKKSIQRGLYIVINFDNFDGSQSAVHDGHHLFIPYLDHPPEDLEQANMLNVDLNPVVSSSTQQAEQLPENGVSLTQPTMQLSIAPKNSFDLSNPNLIKAEWMLDFTSFLLLGGWSRDDQHEVELLLRLNPKINIQEFEKRLLLLSKEPQAPVVQRNKRWKFKSQIDIWPHMAQFVSRTEIETFQNIAKEVLGDFDKQYDVEIDKRWMAGLEGHGPKYSTKTKESISETLILLNVYGQHIPYFKNRSIDWFNSQILNDVLGVSWKSWASSVGILPLLAEAAPLKFIELAQKSIQSGENGLLQIMGESGDGMWGGRPHTSVLWALEILAWNRTYLNPVTGILLALSEYEEKLPQNLVNRPSNSLIQIFSSWMPQTSVYLDERVKVLKSYKAKFPEKIFDLCYDLIPKGHEIGRYSSKPRYRWPDDVAELKLTWKDVYDYRDLIEKLMGEYIKESARYILKILEDFHHFSESFQNNILDQLSFFVPDKSVVTEDKILMRNKIRSLVHDQLSFGGVRLTLEYPIIDELIMYYLLLEPENLVKKFDWLFGDRPQLIDGERDDWEFYNKELQEARDLAVATIVKNGTQQDLLELIKGSSYAGAVAASLYNSNPGYPLKFFEDLDITNEKSKEFFEHYWGVRANTIALNFEFATVKNLLSGFSKEKKFLIYKNLPQNQATWDFIKAEGDEFYSAYWSTAKFWVPKSWNDDAKFIVKKLLEFRRHSENVNFISILIDKIPEKEAIVFEVAQKFVTDTSAENASDRWKGHVTWNIGRIIDYLEKNFPEKANEIATIQFNLLPVLENRSSLTSLFKLLSESPESYAQLIINAYKSKAQDSDSEIDETKRNLASVSHSLLAKWNRLPGCDAENKVDAKKLATWVDKVREILTQNDRKEIGELKIGHVLSKSPTGNDGLWPHEAVRDVIEDSYSDDLGSGFHTAVFNSRGVVSKSIGEGGGQERAIAEKYQKLADELALVYPNTAKILVRLANNYFEYAKREDLRSEDYE